jgi:hypothetical protein
MPGGNLGHTQPSQLNDKEECNGQTHPQKLQGIKSKGHIRPKIGKNF